MEFWVQCVPERMELVERLKQKIQDLNISCDYEHKGCIWNMLNIFKQIKEEYALILQDDVIIPERFTEYIEKVVSKELEGKHLVYLYISPRKEYDRYPITEKRYVVVNDTGQPAYIISKELAKEVLKYYPKAKEKKHDDWLLQEVCKVLKIPIYHHIPGIVQHNPYIDSTMRNPRNIKHKLSRMYNPKIIDEVLKNEN